MKKLLFIVITVVAIGSAWLLFGSYRTSPLHGRLKAAYVTKIYFSSTSTNAEGLNIAEKTVTIRDAAEVAAIENSLTSVRNYYAANSMEGLPKYRMKVQYTDGSTQQFAFTKIEWGDGGRTPSSLLEVLQRSGL